MPTHRQVLHFGNDPLLTDARIQVLEDAGYQVISADRPALVLRLLRTRRVDVIIVCHSVPPDELEAAVCNVKQLKPRLPVVVIHLGRLVGPQRTMADGFIDGLRGPEHLLSQVAAFTHRTTTAAAS
jgi:DNA-binding NtrC family response regulator